MFSAKRLISLPICQPLPVRRVAPPAPPPESASAPWSAENFSCSICLDVFNSPVSTPCGHNFCRGCIATFWDDQVQYKCPVCNKCFPKRPDLQVNTLLSGLADYFRRSVRVKEQSCVAPGEVPCDVCTGTQLKAVKSCLVCFTSYCHTHLEPHQRVPRLKRHELVEPMDRLEDRICQKHDRLLELFCQTEQVFVCQLCTETDHKSHVIVPLEEEYDVKKSQLWEIDSEDWKMIRKKQQKIQEIKDSVEGSKAVADREIDDGEQVLTALTHCIEKFRDDLKQTVKENLESTEKEAEGLIKELEQEIEDLTARRSQVKQLSHTKDLLHFLQTFRALKNPLPTRDWTTVLLRPPSYVEPLRRSLDELKDTLNMEMKKLADLNATLKKYVCELTLDPNTVSNGLSLSEDNRRVVSGDGEEYQSHPDHPERFDDWPFVLCREALTGRSYWEVEWDGGVYIGVAYRGIRRSGGCYSSWLGSNDISWILHCTDDDDNADDDGDDDDNGGDDDDDDDDSGGVGRYRVEYNGSHTDICLPPPGSNRVGVYVDRPAGTLSFYRVSSGVGGSSDTLTHIHTFQLTFTQEDLLPAFGLLGNVCSVSLCRL